MTNNALIQNVSNIFHLPIFTKNGMMLSPNFSGKKKRPGGKLYGLYSFIEAFSGTCHRRSAQYAAWVQDTEAGAWRTLGKIKGTITADAMYPTSA